MGIGDPDFFSFWWEIFILVGALLMYLGWSHDPRPRTHKSKATFRVSQTAIETNGRTFDKNNIHRLIIKNHISKQIQDRPFVTDAHLTSSLVAAGVAAGAEHQQKLSLVANSLELETGGKAYILAGGMDEPTAFGLLMDVRKIIGV